MQLTMVTTAQPAPPEPLLQVEGLHKAFGSNQVLRGVELAVYPGEAVAVVG